MGFFALRFGELIPLLVKPHASPKNRLHNRDRAKAFDVTAYLSMFWGLKEWGCQKNTAGALR